MIKIILADDHNIVRSGLKLFFDAQPGIDIVAEAIHGQEVLDYIDEGGLVDIVLADINMPIMDGIALTKELKKRESQIKVVILSMMDAEVYVFQALAEGASGYLLKNIDDEEMNFALRKISSGDRYICTELVNNILNRLIGKEYLDHTPVPAIVELSMRELEVLQLIAEGYTNAEMADKLFLSRRTVEGHRQALIEKTGAKNTATLIRYAVKTGIVR